MTSETNSSLKADLNIALVSAVGTHSQKVEIGTKNVLGKKTYDMKSQELLDVERQKYAGMKMSETADKREGTFGKKALTFIERVWKTTITRPLHEVKEARVGGELMVAAGVNTAITAEFDAVIDAKARKKIEDRRDNWWKKTTGKLGDLGNQLIGREMELHREKIKLTGDLRTEYLNNPGDKSHPFYQLLHRDTVARESLAEKFASAPADFLHEKDLRSDTVELDSNSSLSKFLKENVFKDIIQDTIDQIDGAGYTGTISEKKRIALDKKINDYFFTDEFTTWRNSLPEAQRKQFENSLTYTQNVLSQAETVLMPLVKDNLAQFRINRELDFNIKLTLGTGQFGPNSELAGISRFSKERISKNATLYEKMRSKVASNPNFLYAKDFFDQGLAQTVALAALNSVASSEVVWAVAGIATGKGLVAALHASVEWVPVVSGLFAAGTAGVKEYKEVGKMRDRFGAQVAEGYIHPAGINAVRAEALRKVDYHRVDLGTRALDLKALVDQFNVGDQSEATILKTLGLLADSKARTALSDRRHINLFKASSDTPDGRANYHQQDMTHTKLRAIATDKLNELFATNDTLRKQIAVKLGFDEGYSASLMVRSLATSQAEFLEKGTTVSTAVQVALHAITPAEAKAIDAQDKAFNKYRSKEVRKKAATSGLLAGLATFGMGHFVTGHTEVVEGGFDHQSVVVLDHNVPNQVSLLKIGEVRDPDTHAILSTMNAHIPQGTVLQADIDHPGAFDLVLSSDPNRVLADNMTFTDGQLNMTPAIQESLAHHHIAYHSVDTGTVSYESLDTSLAGTTTLRYGDLPGAHESGLNQWFANNLNHSYSVTPDTTAPGELAIDYSTRVNGIKSLMYAWEDHAKSIGDVDNFSLVEEPGYHQIMHVNANTGRLLSESQAKGFFMDDVPNILGTEEGHRTIANFIDTSVRAKLSGVDLTPGQEIAYNMSYAGLGVPTPDQYEILMKELGQITSTAATEAPTYDSYFTMTGDLIDMKTVALDDVIKHTVNYTELGGLASVVGYSVPLEAPILNRNIDNLSAYNPSFRYLSGGVNSNLESIFNQRRSKTLDADRAAELNDYAEIDEYLSKLNPTYKSEIEGFADEIGVMGKENKAVVLIPVASHQEGKSIYKSLENYLPQTADKNNYEIVLLANHPANDRSGNTIKPDDTISEIARFRADHPDVPIRVIEKVLPLEKAQIGRVRKYLADVALTRHHRRGQDVSPLILISNDADNKGIAPEYIQNFIDKFEANPKIDGLLGQLDWDPASYVKSPAIHIGTRLFQFLNAKGRHRSGRLSSSGANFAIKSDIFAAIGGYLEESSGGEDIALGQAITQARGVVSTLQFAGPKLSRVYTSSRRAIKSFQDGLAPIEQWDQGFSAFDDEVRRMEISDKIIDYNNPEDQQKVIKDIEYIVNRTIDVYEEGEKLGKDANYYKNTLKLLGIDYKVVDSKIVIVNTDVVLANLREYQQYGIKLRDVKSGNAQASELPKINQIEIDNIVAPRLEYYAPSKLPEVSESLTIDPASKLDAVKERDLYFNRMDKEYLDTLNLLSNQIPEKMDPATEAVVVIPVAGTQESSNIFNTIEKYSHQSVDKSKLELLLFVNAADNISVEDAELFNKTIAEIERAKTSFPGVNVRVMKLQMPRSKINLARLRKFATDVTLMRQKQTGISRDLIIVSNDADAKGIGSRYIDSYIKYFSDNPEKDAAVGNLRYDANMYARIPGLGARVDFINRLDNQGFKNGNIDLFAGNCAYKTSIYAGMDGYPTSSNLGDQEYMGNKIREIRKTNSTLGYAGDETLLVTDARRILMTKINNESQQIRFGDVASEATMRALNLSDYPFYDLDSAESVSKLKGELEAEINSVISEYEKGDLIGKDSWLYKTNLENMGIEYDVIGDPKDHASRIIIKNFDKLLSRVRKVQEMIKNNETNMAEVLEKSEIISNSS